MIRRRCGHILPTAGALVKINVTGSLTRLHPRSPGIVRSSQSSRQCQKLEIKISTDLDQLGRDDSHGAVIDGKGLLELCLAPPMEGSASTRQTSQLKSANSRADCVTAMPHPSIMAVPVTDFNASLLLMNVRSLNDL